MSAGVNKVILIGNLGSDPESRMAGETPVCNFTIATNESWKGKDGQKQDRTEWHRIVVWGKLGENCQKYLAKGRPVYIEGKLQTRSWEKDNVKHYTTEIIAREVKFLGSGQGENSDRPPAPPPIDSDSDIPF